MVESKEPRRGGRRGKDRLGRTVWCSPTLVKSAEWMIRLLLGAVLAGGQVLGGVSPFGIAFVGACGAGSGGLAGLLGAALGYLLSRGLEDGLRYTAGCVLVFSVSFAFFDLGIYRKRWFMPLVTALLGAVTGLVSVDPRRWGATLAARMVGEFALTVLGVYAFRGAFSLWREGRAEGAQAGARQRLGLVGLGMAVLISLSGLELGQVVSVGRLCAVVVTLCAAYAAGPGMGAAVGLASGLAMDLTGQVSRFYAVSYALSGLSAGLLRRQGRFLSALSSTMAAALVVLWSWDSGGPMSALYETAAAGLALLLLPQRTLAQAEELFAGDGWIEGGQWMAQAAQRRLRRSADAFGQVFSALRSAFGHPLPNGEDPSVIYDRAANRVCAACPLRERCWQSGYQDTYDMLNGALGGILESGRAESVSFPPRFRDRCVRFSAFVAAVNEELTAHRLRRRYEDRLGQSRQAVCRQYGDMARALEEAAAAMAAPLTVDQARTRRLGQFLTGRELNCQGLVFLDTAGHVRVQLEGPDAGELAGEEARAALGTLLDTPLSAGEAEGQRLQLRQREPLSAVAGVAGRPRAGQSVSGDACAWFKDEDGRLLLMLCDGMGSGAEARQDSDLTLRLLEKFLRAGVPPADALKTLDQALALRGEATGGFSTVDLLELDLYTGQGTLYKLGAAPSYLRRGGAVTRLAGGTLPAGLGAGGGTAPDRAEFRLGPGDCLVLLTDGVLDGAEDDWLRGAVLDFDGGSPAALAGELVGREEDQQDDRTALVLRIGLRQESPAPQGTEV